MYGNRISFIIHSGRDRAKQTNQNLQCSLLSALYTNLSSFSLFGIQVKRKKTMVMRMDGEKYSRTEKLLSAQRTDQSHSLQKLHHSVAIPPHLTSYLGKAP